MRASRLDTRYSTPLMHNRCPSKENAHLIGSFDSLNTCVLFFFVQALQQWAARTIVHTLNVCLLAIRHPRPRPRSL